MDRRRIPMGAATGLLLMCLTLTVLQTPCFAEGSSRGEVVHVPSSSNMGWQQTRRKMEDVDEEDNEDDEDDDQNDAENTYAFLEDYCQKFITCKSTFDNTNSFDHEYGRYVVVYRLCYNQYDEKSDCDCKEGYGEYILGLNSFMSVYMEHYGDDMVAANNNNVNGFDYLPDDALTQCIGFAVDGNNDDDNADDDAGGASAFYVGPSCTSDGNGVKLGLFLDEACIVPSESVSFSDLTGYELPWSTEEGGLVDTSTTYSCLAPDDDGEQEEEEENNNNDDDNGVVVTDYCQDMYGSSGKCETDMKTTSDDGRQVEECSYIHEIVPLMNRKMGLLIDLIVVGLFLLAVVWYIVHQRRQKRKREAMEGVDSSDLVNPSDEGSPTIT